jgi:hypothetical protein
MCRGCRNSDVSSRSCAARGGGASCCCARENEQGKKKGRPAAGRRTRGVLVEVAGQVKDDAGQGRLDLGTSSCCLNRAARGEEGFLLPCLKGTPRGEKGAPWEAPSRGRGERGAMVGSSKAMEGPCAHKGTEGRNGGGGEWRTPWGGAMEALLLRTGEEERRRRHGQGGSSLRARCCCRGAGRKKGSGGWEKLRGGSGKLPICKGERSYL